MQSGSSDYCFSIGEFGDWIQPDFDEKTIQSVKNQVRAAVRQRLAGRNVSWTLDLNTLSVLRGKTPSTHLHLAIPDDIHIAAIRGWLGSLNSSLDPSEYLWLENQPKVNYLCCAYRNGEWHACGTSALLEGSDEATAKPWEVEALVKNGKQPIELKVPIKVEVSWTCMVDPEREEHHMAGSREPAASAQPARSAKVKAPIFELLPTRKVAPTRTPARTTVKKRR